MARKILMVCSVWNEDYIGGLLRGMEKRIGEEDLELHVFVSYDTSGDSSFQKKEQEIFELPDIENYDGVLIACNSVGSATAVEPLVTKCKKYNKTVLSIEQKFEGVPVAGVGNYREFYRVVEHMITVHGCKVFNYIGGPESNMENLERFRAFCDCMKEHGLPVEEERVGHYRFLHKDGEIAYQKWKEQGVHLPDAVICANDNMAIGYCNAARADGYRIPEDLRISGFDNFDEGQYFSPSITSVNRNWEQLGYDSVDKLLQFMDGIKAPADFDSKGRLALNESCGCALGSRDVKADLAYVYYEKKQKEVLEFQQRMDRLLLCKCRTLTEMRESLKWCLDTILIEDLVLCLNSSLFQEEMAGEKRGYDNILHVITKQEEFNVEKSRTFEPARLFPEENHKIYMFSSLTFGSDTYGYSIAIYEDKLMKNDLYRAFKESATVALESIRQREELSRMNMKLQQLYVQDPMTGLYNRFGYMNQAERYLLSHNREIYLIYIDVDNLKSINDNYGHAMGDLAIRGVAQAIKMVFGDDCICVRMGGDEFLVMDASKEEQAIFAKEQAVLDYLEDYSKRISCPFILNASMGHINSAGSNESLEVLVKQADNMMYEVKQKRKKGML